MILTPFVYIIPPPSLQLDSQHLALCLAVDLCICFLHLLDKSSVMAIKVVINLFTGTISTIDRSHPCGFLGFPSTRFFPKPITPNKIFLSLLSPTVPPSTQTSWFLMFPSLHPVPCKPPFSIYAVLLIYFLVLGWSKCLSSGPPWYLVSVWLRIVSWLSFAFHLISTYEWVHTTFVFLG